MAIPYLVHLPTLMSESLAEPHLVPPPALADSWRPLAPGSAAPVALPLPALASALPQEWAQRAAHQAHRQWPPLTSPSRQLARPGRPLARTLPLRKTPYPKSAAQVRRTPAPRNKLSASKRACVSLARRLRVL